MHFTRVHHIAIICSDYERSKHFYTNILGFRVIHEQYREERRSYKLDLQVIEHTQIELFSFEHPPKRQAVRKHAVCAISLWKSKISRKPSPICIRTALKRSQSASTRLQGSGLRFSAIRMNCRLSCMSGKIG
jgi:catechol 2,3-dioxygenase-like lactoylglutathione lyase family enzyme